jgi:hypothetical protein
VNFTFTVNEKYDPQYLMLPQTNFGNFHRSDSTSNTRFTAAQYDSRRKYVFLFRFQDSALCKAVQPSTPLVRWHSLCHGHRYTVSPFGVAFHGTDCIRKARDGFIKILLVAYDAEWFSSCQDCSGKRYLHFQDRRDIENGSNALFPSVDSFKIRAVTSRKVVNLLLLNLERNFLE